MELMKVLNIILNNNGLRQSPCNTPLPIGMNGVEYEDVVTEVWKSQYRGLKLSFSSLLGCDGIQGYNLSSCDELLQRNFSDQSRRLQVPFGVS